jgi:type 1 glutamine amidotransferase
MMQGKGCSMKMMAKAACVVAAASMTVGCAAQDGRVRALIVTGENNHNWRYTSQMHKDTLEATGKFVVDVTESPASALADAKMLSKYQVVVLDYNDYGKTKRWGQPAEANFTEAVRNGLGVVAVHSANNAFPGWKEYEQMIALLWRENAGHGKFHEFEVAMTDTAHPITAGMPAKAKTSDELYHRLSNPQGSPYTLLAQAMSQTSTGGTGQAEPMALVNDFGKGRIFATPLGHVWDKDENSKPSVATPLFRTLLSRGTEWAATGSVTLPTEWKETAAQNVLTEAEKEAGWELLFDGKELKMRGFKKDKLPGKWKVADGTLSISAGEGEGGDIVTIDQYTNFEFAVEWKASPGANSGIMYRCTEDKNYPWETGPEMQILDNNKHQDGKNPLTSAGSLYAVKAIAHDVTRPAGEWNRAKVVCNGSRIEHWLNGYKVVEMDLSSDEFKTLRDASKWKGAADYATRATGHVALQDHGDQVWFRNIKVRKLP